VGSTVRPMQELIDFQKILLQPGEERTLHFHVDASKLSMWNSKGQCVCEPGMFSFSTGYADHLLLTKQARMTE